MAESSSTTDGLPGEDDENYEIPMPRLEDFVNDPEIQEAYADEDVWRMFEEIEEEPLKIGEHQNNEKIQNVLRLIKAKIDPYVEQFPQPQPAVRPDMNSIGQLMGQMGGGGAQGVNIQSFLSMLGLQNQGQEGGLQQLLQMAQGAGGLLGQNQQQQFNS